MASPQEGGRLFRWRLHYLERQGHGISQELLCLFLFPAEGHPFFAPRTGKVYFPNLRGRERGKSHQAPALPPLRPRPSTHAHGAPPGGRRVLRRTRRGGRGSAGKRDGHRAGTAGLTPALTSRLPFPRTRRAPSHPAPFLRRPTPSYRARTAMAAPPPLCNAPPALRFLSVVPGASSAWRAVPWFPPPRSSAEGSDPRGTPARARSRSREGRGAGPARFSPTGIAAVGARELDRAPVWGELRWNRCKWLPGRDCA